MNPFKIFISWLILVFKKIRFGKKMKISFLQMIHPSTKIYIGKCAHLYLGRLARTRRGCSLLCCSGEMHIGEGLFLNQNVMITSMKNIEIGKEVTIGNNVVIVDHDHNFKKTSDEAFLSESVEIGDFSWIGANSIILRGVHLGHHCVVAAGTVVRKGVYEPYTIISNELKTVQRKYNVS